MPFYLRIIIVYLILFVLEFYFVWKVTGSTKTLFNLPDIKKARKFIWLLLLLLNAYPLIGAGYLLYIQFTGDRDVRLPQTILFDYLVIYPFWTFVFIVGQAIIYLIPLDILHVILSKIFRVKREGIKRFVSKITLIFVVFLAIYVPARIIYDYNSVSTRVTEYKKSYLPSALENFKIVLIADVQADKYTDSARLENYISKVNEVEPDLVLIAGDVITGSPDYINLAAESLSKINSKYGVYACVGDHDNWAYRSDYVRSLKEVTEALDSVNVPMIDNQNLTLDVDSAQICISFITNTYVGRINEQTLDSLTTHIADCDLKIFLTHQPRSYLIEHAKEKDFDLMFAGHTHGGQITFLFPFVDLSPTLIETNYVKGDFWLGNMLLVVNRGLGMSLVPLRYNSTPEVSVIVITSN